LTVDRDPSLEGGVGEPVLVARVGEANGSEAAAAALAGTLAAGGRPGLLVAIGDAAAPRPTVVSSAPARALEERLNGSLPDATAAARGRICRLSLGDDDEALIGLEAALAGLPERPSCVIHAGPRTFRRLVESRRLRAGAAVLRADLPSARAMTGLAARDLIGRGFRVGVMKSPLGWLAARRALAGLPLGAPEARIARLLRRLHGGQRGQVLPLAVGGVAAILVAAVALVSIAGALTGKGRAQRAADLAALSAARSMRDDLPRLLSPPVLRGGLPNPRHLSKRAYLARARAAATRAAVANGVGSGNLRLTFPDRASFAPLRAGAAVIARVAAGADPTRIQAAAVAEAAPPTSGGALPAIASGGGYSGPLVYRQGEGMRPDVAAAFDAMAVAAARDGVTLTITSGFRSDAEQAALFAANPDPQWVAPPGRSLHRCATELDLGPPGAYGWLAANAGRFGFEMRYSWEPWHFGYVEGPPPCSAAGNVVAGAGADGLAAAGSGLPAFVPARFRPALLAAAARWNVSAALLAAQLMAESNFNPYAVSPAGAQGIAQFMPTTAAAYGLRDPFDARAAIDAQAHLMSDLLRQFGSISLALAAYNAGPAPVTDCGCVPAIPETTAYVARILALLDGSGALLAPPFEVRLIE
jgi:Transglycosylase SLT domain/D-alanyl-D-alanine carboxypeptidase